MIKRALLSSTLFTATTAFAPAARQARRTLSMSAAPLAVLVTVEIEPARVPAFLEAMKIDVEGSRKEEGCLRFDLLKDQSKENTYSFYEVYKDAAALDLHKTFDHYKAWADFKAAGGVVSQTAVKMDAVDFTH